MLKFHIYCLINSNDKDQAQLQLDLKKELGFKDDFFEKKFNYLMQYEVKIDEEISEKTILDFHLSHRVNSDLNYKPNKNTSKIIWKYLSTSNLLQNVGEIDLENIEEISIIENATHEKIYEEKDLLEYQNKLNIELRDALKYLEDERVELDLRDTMLKKERMELDAEKIKLVHFRKKLQKEIHNE